MSLTSNVSYDDQGTLGTYYSSEEIMLLKSIDPSFQTQDEVARKAQMSQDALNYGQLIHPYQANYLSAPDLRADISQFGKVETTSLPGQGGLGYGFHTAPIGEQEVLGSGGMSGGMEGGFFGALMGLLPSLLPAIPSIISTISNLFKGKGGVMPPNVGSGINPVNYRVSGYGKQYYKSLYDNSKKLVKDVMTASGMPISSSEIDFQLQRNGFPRSFVKTISQSKKGSGKTSKYKENDDYTLGRPVAKWAMGKLFDESMYRSMKGDLKGLKGLGLHGGLSLKDIFGKVKGFLKGILPVAKPIIETLTKQMGPEVTGQLPGVVERIFSKVTGDESMGKSAADLTRRVATPENLTKLADYGMRALMAKGRMMRGGPPMRRGPPMPMPMPRDLPCGRTAPAGGGKKKTTPLKIQIL